MLALDVGSSVAGRAEGVSKLPGCEVIGTFWLHVSVSRTALRRFSGGQSASCLDPPTELLPSIEGSGEERSSVVNGGRPISLFCFEVLGRSSTLRNFLPRRSLVSSSVLFVASFTCCFVYVGQGPFLHLLASIVHQRRMFEPVPSQARYLKEI